MNCAYQGAFPLYRTMRRGGAFLPPLLSAATPWSVGLHRHTAAMGFLGCSNRPMTYWGQLRSRHSPLLSAPTWHLQSRLSAACTSMSLSESAQPQQRGLVTKGGKKASTCNEENELSLDIDEADIEEQFIRGSGPGGQKINKSSVCVMIKHVPSGIVVRCQETRSQLKNRELARKILQRKLEDVVRGEESETAREASRARARKAKRRRKSVTKHFKSRRDRLLLND